MALAGAGAALELHTAACHAARDVAARAARSRRGDAAVRWRPHARSHV